MSTEDLRRNRMMSHLLDALERGEDIGHYGRLVFTMVARHFVEDEELVAWLTKGGSSHEEARALVEQVHARDYSPPRRDRILEWQKQQEFPICPEPDDPDDGNVYRDLTFPDHVYEHIREYHQEKAHAKEERTHGAE